MAIYLICFFVSLVLISIAGKYKTRDVKFILLSIVAILIPALLAGLRAEIIGTDVMVYVKPAFIQASYADSFEDFLNHQIDRQRYGRDFEFGYAVLVYVMTKLTRSLSGVLFATHFFIISFVYAGLTKYRDRIKVWLGMAVFYLMFFNGSLNMMRQWMAQSVCLYAIHYLEERKILKYFLWVGFSALFHTSSALFGILYFFVFWVIERRKAKTVAVEEEGEPYEKVARTREFGAIRLNKRNLRVALVAVLGIAVLMLLPTIVSLLRSLGLFKYLGYISGNVVFMPNQIIARLPFLLFSWLSYGEFKKYDNANFYVTMIVIDVLLSQLADASTYAIRIAQYSGMFYTLSIPMMCELKKWRKYRMPVKIVLVAYLIYYWYFYFGSGMTNQTVPYIPFWAY